ncbi:unnamed protein product [Umbelopsis sp. WA50703]
MELNNQQKERLQRAANVAVNASWEGDISGLAFALLRYAGLDIENGYLITSENHINNNKADIMVEVLVAASNVTIVGGNSCTSAATSCGITLTQIESYNPDIDCSDLQIGDVMYCQADTVIVVSGSSCTSLAASCNLSLTQFESYNSKIECTALQVASVCGLTITEFEDYNPSISCTDLQIGQVFSCTPPSVTVTYNPSLVCTDLQLGEVVNCVAATATPTTTGVTSTSSTTVSFSTVTVSLGTTYEYRYCLTPGTAFTPDDTVTEKCCVNPGNIYLDNGYLTIEVLEETGLLLEATKHGLQNKLIV